MPSTVWNRVHRSHRLNFAANYGTLLLLIGSVALNVVLSRRLTAFVQPDQPASIIGTLASTIEAKTLSGEAVSVRFGSRPTILYYFSPNCGWCERNWTSVEALVAAVGSQYRFVALSSVPNVADYVETHHLTFEVYSGLTLESARVYHFAGTPQTVVVGADGRITQVWSGAFRGQLQREVERALGVLLPGIPEPASH